MEKQDKITDYSSPIQVGTDTHWTDNNLGGGGYVCLALAKAAP